VVLVAIVGVEQLPEVVFIRGTETKEWSRKWRISEVAIASGETTHQDRIARTKILSSSNNKHPSEVETEAASRECKTSVEIAVLAETDLVEAQMLTELVLFKEGLKEDINKLIPCITTRIVIRCNKGNNLSRDL
jgi:hypothetical protein